MATEIGPKGSSLLICILNDWDGEKRGSPMDDYYPQQSQFEMRGLRTYVIRFSACTAASTTLSAGG